MILLFLTVVAVMPFFVLKESFDKFMCSRKGHAPMYKGGWVVCKKCGKIIKRN